MQQFLGFSVNTLGGGFRGFRAEGKEGFGVSPPVIFSGGKHRRRAPGARQYLEESIKNAMWNLKNSTTPY